MHNFVDARLEELAVQSYAEAFACHGDLGLELEEFLARLFSIMEKRLGADPTSAAVFNFVSELHANDLYLAVACAQASDVAWSLFASQYGAFIRRICNCACQSSNTARELADGLPGQLFLPDAGGRSRIASYEGVSSLTTWLISIIRHEAIRESHLKYNHLESIEQVHDVADEASVLKIEMAIRAGRYRTLIKDSIEGALNLLGDRERSILILRFGQKLQVSQVAQLFGVKPHAITQQIDRSTQKLRKQFISILANRHRLAPAAVEECVTDLLNNPEHSILAFNMEERC
jgi:RNA polymerase sigma-70 factor (ECF subfamily)